MATKNEIAFLGSRMKQLREKNGYSMEDMAKAIRDKKGLKDLNKSSLSRAEAGITKESTLISMAEDYCAVFNMDPIQRDLFMRGQRVVIPDTSALLQNVRLIDRLCSEYNIVIIPNIVIEELTKIKCKNSGQLGKKAWEIINGISYGDKVISADYTKSDNISNDRKIISVADDASQKYHCCVDIITDDTDYLAYLKGNECIRPIHLRDYMAVTQEFVNMNRLTSLDEYFGESYEKYDEISAKEVNAFLPKGNTLIISTIRKGRSVPLEQKKDKIRWLISKGANVNKCDSSNHSFPPLSHAIQMNDYDMFLFLLNECNANPNVGSRNPFSSGKVRQRNEGNMPIMIAAYDGKIKFVEALCNDDRTSINQQDANGFTALMKACMNGHFCDSKENYTYDIRKILMDFGADEKIVDIEGRTASDWLDQYHKDGPMKDIRNRKRYISLDTEGK